MLECLIISTHLANSPDLRAKLWLWCQISLYSGP